MIICPKCGGENADEAAHCGFCGQLLKDEGKQKTMFGMSAVDPDELKKAVEAARQAKAEANEPEKSSSEQAPQFDLGKPTPAAPTEKSDSPNKARATSSEPAAISGESTSKASRTDREEAFAKTELLQPVTLPDNKISGPTSSSASPTPSKPPEKAASTGPQAPISTGAAPAITSNSPAPVPDEGNASRSAQSNASPPPSFEQTAEPQVSPPSFAPQPTPDASLSVAQSNTQLTPQGPTGLMQDKKKLLLIAGGVFIFFSIVCTGGVTLLYLFFF